MFVPNQPSAFAAVDQEGLDDAGSFALAGRTPDEPADQLAAVLPETERSDGIPASGELAGAGVLSPESATADGTFLGVAADELSRHLHADSRSVALVAPALLERFLTSLSFSDRIHVLPDPAQPDEVALALAWCQRLVRGGRHPHLILTNSYLERVFGQIREKLCLESLPVQLIVIPDGGAHDGSTPPLAAGRPACVLAFLRLLPHTVVVAPKDGWELRQMLRFSEEHSSFEEHKGPIAIQVPRGRLPEMSFPDFAEGIDFGRAETLEEGEEVLLLTFGALAAPAIEAAHRLSEQGLSVGVVNARFVEPLDRETIRRLARRVRGIVTLEEVAAQGGFGSAVLELLAAEGLTTPVVVAGGSAVAGSVGEADSSALVGEIVRLVPALIEHRGSSNVPAWKEVDRGFATANQEAARGAAGPQTFGISPAALKREHDLVQGKILSPVVEGWVRAYSTVGTRSRYLWKWCLHGVELTILPCVLPELAAHVSDTKLLSIILCVVFDDVADQHGTGSLLEAMLHVTREGTLPDMVGLSEREMQLAEVTWQLWRDYRGRIATYPYHSLYADLLHYDLSQFFNTMSYSQLLNRQLPLLNLAEHDLYTSHNMQMISFSTLDLMCSVEFDMEELGKLREAMWHAQCMGRIGNLLSTWRREIPDRDFTSGVFARAVSQGDLTIEQLLQGDPAEIEAVILRGEHEMYFYRRWLHHRERLRSRGRQIHSIDLTRTMDGHDRFFLMHLGSRGLI